jgi:predicted nucleic acid-binding protein
MTKIRRLFVDTNILIYAIRAASPFHQSAIAALEHIQDIGFELWINRQILRELCAGLLKPEPSFPHTHPDFVAAAAADIADRYFIADESEAVTRTLLKLIVDHQLNWRLIHDANIVATMLNGGAGGLLTNNPDDFVWAKDLITVASLSNYQFALAA